MLGRKARLLFALLAVTLTVTAAPSLGSPEPGVERTADIAVTSAALGRTSTVRAFLPKSYRERGKRAPVVYYLHDAMTTTGSTAADEAVALGVHALTALGVVVAVIDADAAPACATCLWIDGRDGAGVLAESYLVDEVVPAVERELTVRRDRGGRGVTGLNMGATGALVQAFRHPDLFGAVGAVGPVLDLADPARGARHATLLATQGYPPPAAAEALYRNVSPLDLAPQVISTNQEIVITSADTAQDGPAAVLTELGVPHAYIAPAGSDAEAFATHVAPRLADALSKHREPPWRFSMKSTDTTIRAWGWTFAARRPNVEFLHIAGARLDGRDVILAGTGVVDVTTPAEFEPGASYVVRLMKDSLPDDPGNDGSQVNAPVPDYLPITADGAGRLRVTADLFPARTVDQQQSLADTGQFQFHHVRIEVFDDRAAAEFGSWPDNSGDPVRPVHRDVAQLAAPYDSWGVTLTTDTRAASNPAGSPQVLELSWDSPAVQRRVSARVWVPDSYLRSSERFPALYFLHGTGGGNAVDKQGFHGLLDRMRFVAVAPDAGSTPTYCTHCYWIDPREFTGGLDQNPPGWDLRLTNQVENTPRRLPVAGGAAFLDETIPLVEALFEVRTDRAGRGISGNSMGSLAATNHAFWRPDRYALVEGLSGVIDTAAAEISPTQWAFYVSFQNYPPPHNVPALYRQLSPYHLAPGAVGANLELIWSVGRPCRDETKRYCTEPYRVESSTWSNTWINENYARPHHDITIPRVVDLGLPFTHPEFTGRHYSPDGEVFTKWMLGRVNQTFRDPAPEPDWFSYKSLQTSFSVWGYDVVVDRPNKEFLHLLGARRDGRDLIVAGTGRVALTLPAAFAPGRAYRVEATRDGQPTSTFEVTANDSGRLVLPAWTLGPTRDTDERIELVEAGLFAFPHTRIRVHDTS